MIFRARQIHPSIIIVYGFVEEKPHFDLVLTLRVRNNETSTHGFLSKVTLNAIDFEQLYKFLQHILETRYLIIESLLDHSIIYKRYMPVVDIKKSLIFDKYVSEKLKIDLTKDLMNIPHKKKNNHLF
jgi:hypothetical protein